MDPLSALSVASSVIAFVDFGGKLVTQFCEIRDSDRGQPQAVSALETSAKDLSAVALEAQKNVQGLEASYPRMSETLARLNSECIETESEMKALCGKMTVNVCGNKLRTLESSTRASFRALLSEKQVEEWRKKLDRIRTQVTMNVLMCLWYVY